MRQKNIEDKYQELSEVEHIRARSGMYVGSTQQEEKEMFIYNPETAKMELKYITYVPAMLKVIDEIISNSCDEFRRKDNLGLTTLKVSIDKESGRIIIEDNGGIPVVIHKTAGVYVPEFIFGRLRTSSNYDDTEDRNVIGTNGVGSSLCNVFSRYFEIETCDGKNKFHRSWSNGMNLNDDLEVTKAKKSDHGTKTTIDLDFSCFNCDGLSDDFISIIYKRCIDAAAANPGLRVYFENDEWLFKSFDEYLDLYSGYINLEDKIAFKNSLCIAYIFPDSTSDIGFVNGAECSKGTHMRALRSAINQAVAEYVTKKDKLKDLSPRSIENKYSVFMSIDISNPAYSSQTKEELTTQVQDFSRDESKTWSVDEKFLKNIASEKSEIVNLVRDWYKKKTAAEDEKALRKLNKESGKGLKRPDKYIVCSSRRKDNRSLWIFEGDSARSGFRTCRNPETQAGYTMRGVPLNCYDMQPIQIMKNEVFSDLVNIIGLKWGEKATAESLNFSKIVIASDMDVDGDKICSLLVLFFNNWPELFEQKIVVRSVSPIIIARKGKEVKKYFTLEEYRNDEKAGLLSNFSFKYTKGIGSCNQEETKEMYWNPTYMEFYKDHNTDNMFKKWFNKFDSNTRKTMLND